MRKLLIGVCKATTLYSLYEGLAGSLLQAGFDPVMLIGNDTLIQQSQSSKTGWVIRAAHDGEENRLVTVEAEEGDPLILAMTEAGIALWAVSRPIVGDTDRPSTGDWFELLSRLQPDNIPTSPTVEELELLRLMKETGMKIKQQIETAGPKATGLEALLLLDLLDPIQQLVENTSAG